MEIDKKTSHAMGLVTVPLQSTYIRLRAKKVNQVQGRAAVTPLTTSFWFCDMLQVNSAFHLAKFGQILTIDFKTQRIKLHVI